jgi:diguanylate cyclase (GGDEF)-like protein/PAS domain S-box-containing protein
MTEPRSRARRIGALLIVVCVLAGGLVATALTADAMRRSSKSELSRRFTAESIRMTERITQELNRYEDLLLATQGLFDASGEVTAEDFDRFTAPLQLDDVHRARHRGLFAVGFAPLVLAEDGTPSAPVTYVAPRERNLAVHGFDILTNPLAAEAVERAARTGTPAMSAPLTLAQDTERQPGVVLYLPIADSAGGTAGWVYTAFRVQDFLSAAVDAGSTSLAVRVHDTSRSGKTALATIPRRLQSPPDDGLSRTVGLNHGGRTWLLEFASLPSGGMSTEQRQTRLVWVTGLALTALVCGVMLVLERALGAALGEVDSTARRMRSTQAHHRKVLENLQEVVFTTDATGRWTFLNPAWETLTGVPVSAATGRSCTELVHPADRAACEAGMRALLDGTREAVRLQLRMRLPGGDRWVDVLTTVERDSAGQTTGTFGTLEDITERRDAELALRESEKRSRALANILDATSDIVWTNDPDGRLRYLNETGRRLLGIALSANPLVDDFFVDGGRQLRTIGFPSALTHRVWNGESTLRLTEGVELPVSQALIAHHDEHGAIEYFSAVLRDISVPKALEAELAHQAGHDPLTGLPNRTLLLPAIGQALTRARRRHTGTALLFLDLDRFKVINDSLGHAAGDEVLRATAARLLEAVRESDMVARLGGDEFTVVCEDVNSPEEAVDLAERLAARLRLPMGIRGHEVAMTVSVGVVFHDAGRVDPEHLLHQADAAMYQAKDAGKNRWWLANGEQGATESILAQEQSLRRAIERQELVLHYQPVVQMPERTIVGFEALVRWQHPERGLLPPAAFLPLAEESGLIGDIGRWVLAEACNQIARWRHTMPGCEHLTISVNLSPTQLRELRLCDDVVALLAEVGLDPSALCLEVTEHALLRDADTAAHTVRALRAHGVHVAIDDFGTGYSSLAHLRELSVDVLKIDRTFVQGMGEGRTDEAIVSSIVAMGSTIGLTVIAEGAETDAQLALLERLGCTLVQGFRLARPAGRDEAARMLRDGLPAAALTG